MHVVRVKNAFDVFVLSFFVISVQRTLKRFSDKVYCNNDINNANGSF